jgi:hypothetical protein
LSQELKAAQAKAESDEDKLDIERFKAQTDRMKVIAELEQKGALTDAQLHQLALANLQSTLALGNTGEAEEINEESEPMDQQPAEQSVQPPTEG